MITLPEKDELEIELEEVEDEIEDLEELDEELEELQIDTEIDIEPFIYSSNGELGRYLMDVVRFPRITPDKEIELAKIIEIAKEAKAILTDENREELAPIIKDGQVAREDFINANYRLVIAIAKHYFKQCTASITMLDIIQSGNLGLIKAVDRFDYTKGWKFSTYATWWIRQAIKRELFNTAHTIRLPVHIQETLARIYLYERDHKDATVEEIAEALSLSVAKIHRLLEIRDTMLTVSLDVEINTTDSLTALVDIIPSDILTPAEVHIISERKEQLTEVLLAKLTDRELYVISRRFGLSDEKPQTLEVIGTELGITRERVRQIEDKALRKLRSSRTQAQLRDILTMK